MLKATGYQDSPALTGQSSDGDIPHGRELSFAWLSGTVMTGLTSVLLMGAALYVSFQGQNNFSTAYEALRLAAPQPETITRTDMNAKSDRVRPVARTRSELETIEASIRENVDGRDIIRKQPFMRIRATLATAGTALSSDIPTYDPVAILSATAPTTSDNPEVNTDIYGAEVEGEVAMKLAPMPVSFVPPRAINDQTAALYVRQSVETAYADVEPGALAYASAVPGVRELGIADTDTLLTGVAENVTVIPQTTSADELGLGRTERILTMKDVTPLDEVLKKNGFTDAMVAAITNTLHNVFPVVELPRGARLRILFGPSRTSNSLIPYRMSIYVHDDRNNTDVHRATVALTDKGQYVLGLKPAPITFPEEDTEEINVANLPSIYRSIWETGRKHDLDDATIKHIIGMYAYDVDMNKRIGAGDSIEILETEPDASGQQDLLYVGLTLGTNLRQLYRFVSPDGGVSYLDPEGQTGKRFLNRRPLKGGGTLRSRFGYRIHPIFHTRKLHTGVDLAAPRGTPIYAAGDGAIEFAGRQSGYGNKVEIKHVNGYETAYAHMNAFAKGIKVGTKVRQGQIIGYVGTTGYSTGPHLHFEVKINGNLVDPLSVKLPRENTLRAQDQGAFKKVVAQINDLMQRAPAPVSVASN
ncbi:M23 family metallopeptidase [Devosia rhodophyticola]|uniref:M23 family metallopeptidase n=1 Tax=Devosia rhodophyticola TaxID=3026423 RepID=A0ABY7YUJ5_9HYPH|nr:M23 family metallopeptidase [Devosia rhodophyticola]WDR04720.1 M23 family metallopeptidase [Devosia rhodophyticola]